MSKNNVRRSDAGVKQAVYEEVSWGIQERFSRDHQFLRAVINQELENLEFYVSKQAMHRLCGAGTGSTMGILKRVMTSAKKNVVKAAESKISEQD